MSIPHFAPVWILCMWAGFAAQINHVMNRLRGKYFLIGFYGLLAPLAYMAGETINAASIADGDINYAIISISWAISLILLFKISNISKNEMFGSTFSSLYFCNFPRSELEPCLQIFKLTFIIYSFWFLVLRFYILVLL